MSDKKEGLGDKVEKIIHTIAPVFKKKECPKCRRRKAFLNKISKK